MELSEKGAQNRAIFERVNAGVKWPSRDGFPEFERIVERTSAKSGFIGYAAVRVGDAPGAARSHEAARRRLLDIPADAPEFSSPSARGQNTSNFYPAWEAWIRKHESRDRWRARVRLAELGEFRHKAGPSFFTFGSQFGEVSIALHQSRSREPKNHFITFRHHVVRVIVKDHTGLGSSSGDAMGELHAADPLGVLSPVFYDSPQAAVIGKVGKRKSVYLVGLDTSLDNSFFMRSFRMDPNAMPIPVRRSELGQILTMNASELLPTGETPWNEIFEPFLLRGEADHLGPGDLAINRRGLLLVGCDLRGSHTDLMWNFYPGKSGARSIAVANQLAVDKISADIPEVGPIQAFTEQELVRGRAGLPPDGIQLGLQ
jgi:hypothetical protein